MRGQPSETRGESDGAVRFADGRITEDGRTVARLQKDLKGSSTVALMTAIGRNFDLDFHLWTAEAGYKITSQLSLEYELQRPILDPDPDSESTWINVVGASRFFTKDLFLRVIFQTNSACNRYRTIRSF